MLSNRILKKAPYFFLLALSFYPLMKSGITSVTAILFLLSTLLFYNKNFRLRYREYGLKPLLVNSGFYFLLLLSIGYSENTVEGFKKVQASLLLLFFPFVVIYFLPKIEKKIFKYLSYGFISANFILLLYFFNILVDGLEIDRFANLSQKGFLEQLQALNTYPYEFVLSKAHKHLEVIYESHKVYVSLHFLLAILLSVRLLMDAKTWAPNKILLGILIIFFSLAIIYSQAITTVLALVLLVILFPFLYLNGNLKKAFYIGGIALLLIFGNFMGAFDTYDNKNTESVFKLFEAVFDSGKIEKDADKRIYIYDCSIDLIKEKPFFGHGVGDVQSKLNACYSEKNYVVAEYESVGSDINSHNYYLHIWLSTGVLGLIALLLLFISNLITAFRATQYVYVFFLLAFALSLLTENILVRMAGVFLFAIFNSLFYSFSTIDVKKK